MIIFLNCLHVFALARACSRRPHTLAPRSAIRTATSSTIAADVGPRLQRTGGQPGSLGEPRYNRWYHSHRNNFGPDDAAASIFGFIAGAAAGAITGSINGGANYGSHEARCDARYRSYDPGSDTFLGYDGNRHYCRL